MRERNGHVDDGSILKSSIGKRCPNCGSASYLETLSRESCSSCGLECDYWGGGANEVYESMMARNYALEEEERKRLEKDDW